MEKQREIDGLEQQQRSSAVDYNAFDGDEYHESNGNTAVITIIFGLFYCSSCFFLEKKQYGKVSRLVYTIYSMLLIFVSFF